MVLRKKSFELEITGHLNEVVSAFEYRIRNMDEFPEMENEETLSIEESPEEIIIQRYLSLELPAVLLKLLPGDFQRLMEELHYFPKKSREQFAMFFENRKDRFLVECKSAFTNKPGHENMVLRRFDVQVQVDLPLIGGVAASTALSIFSSGLEKDNAGLVSLVQKRKES